MEQYKYEQEGIKNIINTALLKSMPLFIIIFIAVFLTSQTIDINNLKVIVLSSALFILMLIISYILSRKRLTNTYKTFLFSISDVAVIREQKDTPIIIIKKEDVSIIIKNANGSIIIKGKNPLDIILILPQIDNYNKLVTELNQILPVSEKTKLSVINKFKIPIILIFPALLLVVYTVKDKIIVTGSGIVLFIFMIWSFIFIQKSKNTDIRTKRSAYWLVLIMLSVICAIIARFIE